MASTDARPIPIKNTAYRVTFPILNGSGDLVTGASGLDSEVSKDAGTFADCTNEATEIATSSCIYYLDLTATEMNADCVVIVVKTSTSGAKTTPIVLYPQEAGDIKVDVQSFGGTAGTFASGRPEVNMTHIAGAAVSATTAQLGVNVVNAAGTAWGSGAITAASIASGALTSAKFAAGAFDAVWTVTARLLTAGTNIVLAKGTGITGFTDLDASGVRGAVGLASANLDSQIATLATASNLATVANYLDTEIADILADTNELQLAWTVGGRLDLVLAARSSQTSVDDLPTNAEFAAALAGADDAVLAAISTLSIPTAADNASAVLAKAFEGAETVQDFFRLARAALYGKSVGMETTGPAFRDKADTKSRIQVVGADEFGNRPVVNLDPS